MDYTDRNIFRKNYFIKFKSSYKNKELFG